MNAIGAILLLALAAQDGGSTDLHIDFRNKNPANIKLWRTNPDPMNLMKAEPEGLRITVPADPKLTGGIGFLGPAPIKGDVEVTLGYEILEAAPPKNGFGVGIEFYLKTDSPTKEAVGLYRHVRPNGNDVYSCTQMTSTEKGQRVPVRGSGHGDVDFPAHAKAGRLRITRVGPQAILSAAEQGDQDFRVLYRMDLGTGDVIQLSFGAHPGAAPNPVDLRLVDFSVRHLDPTAAASAKATDSSRPAPAKMWPWLLATLLALGILLCGVWGWTRRTRTAEAPD